MGTWGIGNFDSDNAREFIDDLYEHLIGIIQRELQIKTNSPGSFLEHHGEIRIIPAIDVIITLFKRYQIAPPIELDMLHKWHKEYMEIFDQNLNEIIALFGRDDFYEPRRKVVDQTFQELIDLITEWENDDNGA